MKLKLDSLETATAGILVTGESTDGKLLAKCQVFGDGEHIAMLTATLVAHITELGLDSMYRTYLDNMNTLATVKRDGVHILPPKGLVS